MRCMTNKDSNWRAEPSKIINIDNTQLCAVNFHLYFRKEVTRTKIQAKEEVKSSTELVNNVRWANT